MARRVNDPENTQQLSQREIDEALQKYDEDDNDYDGLSRKAVGAIVAVIVILVIILATVFMMMLNSIVTDGRTTDASSDVNEVETDNKATDVSTSVTPYQLQMINTQIVNTLNDEYGFDGYTKPSTEDYKLSGSATDLKVNFDVTVGNMNESNFEVPAEFNFAWDETTQGYKINTYTLDEDTAVKSDFKAHKSNTGNSSQNTTKSDSDKENKKNTESVDTAGEEISSFDVDVRNGVTVDLSCASGTVTVYAIASDGTTTEVASASGNSINKTVDLESGSYKLALYSQNASGYSWSYQLN